MIKSLLEKAGFKNVKEREVSDKVQYDDFWIMMNDVPAPRVGALSKPVMPSAVKLKTKLKHSQSKIQKIIN